MTTIANLPADAIEAFMAEPEAYDLVITDYTLPTGNGLELAEDMHALRPDLPFILTTGNTNFVADADLANAGIRAVFSKPLNSEQLLARIRGLLTA